MFSLLAECGYQGVELNLTQPLGIEQDSLERMLKSSGLVVPSFMTGEAYHDGLCLSSPHPEVRSAAVQLLISHIEVAERFGSLLVLGQLRGRLTDEPDADLAEERIVAGLKQVAEQAERRGVEFVIEPVNHLQVGFHNTLADVLRLIDKVGSSAMKPMVDTVHMNIEETSLTEPIRACSASLRHIHVCESNGGLLGSGHVDFSSVFSALEEIGYEGFASVKVYRNSTFEQAARSSLAFLQKVSRICGTSTAKT